MAYVERRGKRWRVRYFDDAGRLASLSGYTTKTAADAAARDVETDQSRGVFLDPKAGDVKLGEWVEAWLDALHVSAATSAKYDVFLRRHILPKFGRLPLRAITRLSLRAWVKGLRQTHAESTVAGIFSLLSSILEEAVEERLIQSNPCRRVKAGDPAAVAERPFADEYLVANLARHCGDLGLLVTLTAYTGLRWGEVTGLRRQHLHLAKSRLDVVESLHEVKGALSMGPPKTAAAKRQVALPPFLVDMLREHLAALSGEHLFLGDDGGYLRRSNFSRRFWRTSLVREGLLGRLERGGDLWAAQWQDRQGVLRTEMFNTEYKAVTAIATRENRPGMHFHDLRHTHKTWLIEDGVPEVAQAKRLGHKMRGVQGIYSHVTPEVERRLVAGLQERWERSQGIRATEAS